jgi:hypothetical protein
MLPPSPLFDHGVPDPPPTADLGERQPTSPALPALAGRYRLDKFLARGGMGEVYRVLDSAFDRPLALKVLQEQIRGQADVAERFLREARLTGQLQHPGIPPVQEVGCLDDGRPYFIMKLVQGRDLHALLCERPSAQEQLSYYLSVFEQVCRTVAYAHARGILHRDLKPANVMVGAFGEVQVMDWGLAKLLPALPTPAAATAADTTSTALHVPTPPLPAAASAVGDIIGTPAYMAPEQARGEVERLDLRCDVFGLGGILCEMLTGQPPFVGGDKLDKQRRAMKGDLAGAFGRLDQSGADAELIALARRCLAPERAERFADAGAVAQAVAGYQELVRQRWRQAELAQAQAQVRIDEERKRLGLERQKRRVTLVLAAAVLLVLLAGMVGTTVALLRAWEQTERAESAEGTAKDQAALAEQQRGQAVQENARAVLAEEDAKVKAQLAASSAQEAKDKAEIARKVKDFLVVAFSAPDPHWVGQQVTVAEVLQAAEQQIAQLDQPLLQEELLVAIGRTYGNLRLPAAVGAWEKVVALQTQRLGADHPDILISKNNLAGAYYADGQVKKALLLYEETLSKLQVSLGPDDRIVLRLMDNLASAYEADGQMNKALPLFEETCWPKSSWAKSTNGAIRP